MRLTTTIALTTMLLFLVLRTTAGTPHTEVLSVFKEWMHRYNKQYTSPEEEAYRFTVFADNYAKIAKHTSASHTPSFTLNANAFADITIDEFRSAYLGYTPGDVGTLRSSNTAHRSLRKSLPQRVDWRENEAVVGKVKNQGKCGSCWAFSMIGAVEGLHGVVNAQYQAFSEQQIMDCCRIKTLSGCNGGKPEFAYECARSDGFMAEEDYPYMAQNQKRCLLDDKKVKFRINSYRTLEGGNGRQFAEAVSQQPISICMTGDTPAMVYYAGGILDESACPQTWPNHCTTLVGYDTTPDGSTDYWIVRNSWGTHWGEGGYMRIKKDITKSGPGVCGVTMEGTYPVLEKDDDGDVIEEVY